MNDNDHNPPALSPEVVELCRQLNEARDERDMAEQRLQTSTDWYQQRFNALRKWVETEVRPLSEDTARRYFAICANGSPAAHESADWKDTLHGLTLRAENAELRLRESRSLLQSIADLVEPGGDGTPYGRIEAAIRTLTEERNDALRRLDSFIKMADYNADCMEKHLTGVIQEREVIRSERDQLRAQLNDVDSDYLMSERQMTQALKDEFNRGVEKMRAKVLELIVHNSHEDGPGLGSARLESAISSMTVDNDVPPNVRVTHK